MNTQNTSARTEQADVLPEKPGARAEPVGEEEEEDEEEEDDLTNEILDLEAFNQLLSMDDDNDEEYEFSREIVSNYLEQAKTTFADMEKALDAKDLSKLSSLGHFLKGSSATIGVKKVQECCKRIQFLGKLHNITGQGSVDEEEALALITKELKAGKEEYSKAKEFLGYFYETDVTDDNNEDAGADDGHAAEDRKPGAAESRPDSRVANAPC
ncbi:Phosphorelay intermediate protein [Coemansia sp. RSA 552]|nr:Phosphorelay intermediate protein [Coemansia sp. RSA 552]